MQKRSSDKGSGKSAKKSPPGTEAVGGQKDENSVEVTELVAQKELDETDEEAGSLPPLTSLSNDNIQPSSPVDSDTVKTPEDTAEAAMTKIQGSAHEGTGTSISSQIQKIIARELSTPAKRGKIDLQSVPLKEYVELTVLPIVHQGLMALARERPAAPIEYLAAYFLKHKHKYQSDHDHEQQPLYSMDQEKSNDLVTAASGNAQQANSNTAENTAQGQGSTEMAALQT